MISRLLSRADLALPTREAMFRVLDAQFEGACPEVFQADLDAKNWVLLMLDDAGEVRGFTTLLHYRSTHRGQPVQVVYSGDTVVDSAAAGTSVLWRSWLGAVNHLRGNDPAPLYWLLIVSGFRTYRFMPMFWKEFHPRHGTPMPDEVRELRDALAGARFGSRYDPETGIVRLASPQVLRADLRTIPPNRMSDPDVAYFAQADPGHACGDELVCLTRIAPENLTGAGRRMWEAGEREFPATGALR
jgi:hypothetical protein